MAGTALVFQTETGDDGCPGAARLSENVFVTPEAVALKVAVSFVVTCPTVALKPALEAPDLTVTLDGTATLELLVDKLTGKPLEGAEPVSVTVHEVDPGPVTVPGLHERPLNAAGPPPLLVIERLPPTADKGIDVPSAALANPDRVIGMPLLDVVPDTVNVTLAIVPAAMMFSFSPYNVQTVLPELLLQSIVFPSATGELVSATLTAVISVPE